MQRTDDVACAVLGWLGVRRLHGVGGEDTEVAAAAVLMAGMRRMAVDGLEGGEAAGHDQLRGASD
jgi:hypothetical protein